jgi:hypothetical protein
MHLRSPRFPVAVKGQALLLLAPLLLPLLLLLLLRSTMPLC